MSEYTRLFGSHVRGLRRARKLTQEVLAERSGLSADTIRRLEHGAFSASLDTLCKLCTGLGLSPATLFESFELGRTDHVREFVDLIACRSPRELRLLVHLVRALLDYLDEVAGSDEFDQS